MFMYLNIHQFCEITDSPNLKKPNVYLYATNVMLKFLFPDACSMHM